jgi:sigma-E factor negative regulatory protein RseB
MGMGWVVRWVPNGFVGTDSPDPAVGRRTYTDGLAVFSVFMEELGREIRPGEGVVRNGGTVSYTRGMDVAGRPVLVTVIGEVPVNTARMVADSVGWER